MKFEEIIMEKKEYISPVAEIVEVCFIGNGKQYGKIVNRTFFSKIRRCEVYRKHAFFKVYTA